MAAPTSTKEQLPTLAGKKIKTRKRDEKVKYDPTSFVEQVIAGLNETDGSKEEIAKFLDSTGGQMDYRLRGLEHLGELGSESSMQLHLQNCKSSVCRVIFCSGFLMGVAHEVWLTRRLWDGFNCPQITIACTVHLGHE